MNAFFKALWPLLPFIGAAIVGFTGWIKTLLDLRKILRAPKQAVGLIQMPSNEDVWRYGNIRRYEGKTGTQLIVLAIGCACVCGVSAAIVVPTIIETVKQNNELHQKLEQARTDKPSPVASPEQSTTDAAMTPTAAPSITPQATVKAVNTPAAQARWATQSRAVEPPPSVYELNRQLLFRLYYGEYWVFIGFGRDLKDTISPDDFASLRAVLKERVGPGWDESLVFLDSIRQPDESVVYLWKLRGHYFRGQILEMLTLNGRDVKSLKFEYDFTNRGSPR